MVNTQQLLKLYHEGAITKRHAICEIIEMATPDESVPLLNEEWLAEIRIRVPVDNIRVFGSNMSLEESERHAALYVAGSKVWAAYFDKVK